MAQQTAVNFLLRELRIEDLAKGEQLSVVLQICEKAKQMEKEQIQESWNDGNFLGRNGNILLEYNTGKQYYNETYNK